MRQTPSLPPSLHIHPHIFLLYSTPRARYMIYWNTLTDTTKHSLTQKSSSGRQIAAESIPVMVLDLDGLLLEEREEGRKTPVPGDDGLLPNGLGLAGW